MAACLQVFDEDNHHHHHHRSTTTINNNNRKNILKSLGFNQLLHLPLPLSSSSSPNGHHHHHHHHHHHNRHFTKTILLACLRRLQRLNLIASVLFSQLYVTTTLTRRRRRRRLEKIKVVPYIICRVYVDIKITKVSICKYL